MTNNQPLLRIEGLVKRYGAVTVLDGIDLSQWRGEVKVLMGSSGTGKSTLLRCINLLSPPNEGRIWLEDQDITAKGTDVDKVRGAVGMVFQDFNLFAHLTAIDNIRIGLIKVRKMSKAEATEIAEHELSRVGLGAKAKSYPAELSGGQQQRVSIARALALKPKLLLFDEPTSALDPELTGEVLAVMTALAREGTTMLIASHEVAFAESVADEIVFMDSGKVVESGPPSQVIRSPSNARAREFFSRMK